MTTDSKRVFGQGRKRIAIYARVSTFDQQTLPMQLTSMQDYVARCGWEVTAEVEETASGAAVRSGRNRILELARQREIDAVVVWKLDRWGRSLPDLVSTLEELAALGVSFVSVTESLDFSTPSGRAMAGMLAVFAEFERDLLRDRVKAGIADARKRGKPHGRPATARANSDRVIQLFRAGHSKRSIATMTGIGRTSVRRIIHSACETAQNATS